MLEAGAIHLSQSPWCNPVILVQKKDGTLHFCMDFRHLYACMKKDSYPLPQIQEALKSMAGSVHFLSMDFKLGLWQIKMAPGSQQYMAFMVGNLGFYEFTRMPFGLCNAPVTFQHLMQNTLGELNLTYCVIYLDDVIVFSRMEEEHLECLCMVFKRFQEFNLKLKPSKCSFFQSEIVYLVHDVTAPPDDVTPKNKRWALDVARLKHVNMELPKNGHQTQGKDYPDCTGWSALTPHIYTLISLSLQIILFQDPHVYKQYYQHLINPLSFH